MAKIATDMTGYAPAGESTLVAYKLTPSNGLSTGYITDNTEKVRGLSPLHDSGTGAGGMCSLAYFLRRTKTYVHIKGATETSRSCLPFVLEASAAVPRVSKRELSPGLIMNKSDAFCPYC